MIQRCFHSAWMLVFGLALALTGCPAKTAAPPAAAPKAEAHAEEGPHKGHLIELGEEEYHAELIHEDATKTVAIYLLGADARTAVSIPDPEIMLNLVVAGTPMQAKLTAERQPGDPEGQASKFAIVDEQILEALEAPKTTGRLNVTIGGKSYSGNVEHEGDHGHDKK